MMNWYKQAESKRIFSTTKSEKKKSSRKEQDRALRDDVRSVLFYREQINAKTNCTFDTTRILGVVAAGKGAENYLPYTIPKIIQQVSELGKGADIVIGLNNGFECQSILDRFTLLPDVQVIHLYTGEKTASTVPSEIFDNSQCEGQPYLLSAIDPHRAKHRVLVVHQKEGLYSAGKIRVLGDIYGSLLWKSIENGWTPPKFIVAFDAESQFLVNQQNIAPKLESNGLLLIVNELQNHPEIDLLGANNRYVVYRKNAIDGIGVFLPDFNAELPPIQWFLNILHGKYLGYKYKPAGCTVGKVDTIISLFAVIAERYPGTRIDDVHLTILAQNAGFRGDIFMSVVSTNRVPNPSDRTTGTLSQPAWIEQVYRWSTGIHGLEINYGNHNVRPICSASFPWNILIDPIGFWQAMIAMEKLNFYTGLKKMKVLIYAFWVFIKIRKKALENPDRLRDPEANASW